LASVAAAFDAVLALVQAYATQQEKPSPAEQRAAARTQAQQLREAAETAVAAAAAAGAKKKAKSAGKTPQAETPGADAGALAAAAEAALVLEGSPAAVAADEAYAATAAALEVLHTHVAAIARGVHGWLGDSMAAAERATTAMSEQLARRAANERAGAAALALHARAAIEAETPLPWELRLRHSDGGFYVDELVRVLPWPAAPPVAAPPPREAVDPHGSGTWLVHQLVGLTRQCSAVFGAVGNAPASTLTSLVPVRRLAALLAQLAGAAAAGAGGPLRAALPAVWRTAAMTAAGVGPSSLTGFSLVEASVSRAAAALSPDGGRHVDWRGFLVSFAGIPAPTLPQLLAAQTALAATGGTVADVLQTPLWFEPWLVPAADSDKVKFDRGTELKRWLCNLLLVASAASPPPVSTTDKVDVQALLLLLCRAPSPAGLWYALTLAVGPGDRNSVTGAVTVRAAVLQSVIKVGNGGEPFAPSHALAPARLAALCGDGSEGSTVVLDDLLAPPGTPAVAAAHAWGAAAVATWRALHALRCFVAQVCFANTLLAGWLVGC
jgi:hypothetical protein